MPFLLLRIRYALRAPHLLGAGGTAPLSPAHAVQPAQSSLRLRDPGPAVVAARAPGVRIAARGMYGVAMG